MKILTSLAFLFSLNAFADFSLMSKEEIRTLNDSVDRVIPAFKEFQKTVKGTSSYSLYLSNACARDIVAYVRYLNLDDKWIDAGFWTLAVTKETYVGETRNAYYYPGAYSLDGELVWGDIPIVFKGYDLYVSERKIDSSGWGDWVQTFSCD